MIGRAKNSIKRHWPRLRLRTILFATLFTVAALPGFGALFLRVYENTLVRQTEAELVAQGAALSATAAALWPSAAPGRPAASNGGMQDTGIDLSTTPILAERPLPRTGAAILPDAAAAGLRLAPVLEQTRRETLASVILLDRAGGIVTGSPLRGNYVGVPEVAAALAGHPTTALRRNAAYRAVYRFEWLSRAAAIRVHYARPVIVNGRVVSVLLLSRSARALFRGLYDDRGKIAFGVGAILVLLVVLTGIISRAVTRPIEQLGAATRAVAAGRGEVPDPPPTAAVEIQGLYADFAAMADAIERRSRYLRDFAHAVSHEFKTPLAGIRGALELLADHPDMPAADRHRFLANADADAGRLTLLVTRLLDLARADMAAPGEHAADPLPVIAAVADAYRSAGLAVETRLASPLPPIALPTATLEAVLTTLFDNSRQAGAATIRLTATVVGDAVDIRVGDDGPGIASADRSRLFEPFFTTRRTDGGTGLGLAIARSLLHASGGSIELTPDRTTTFAIRAPLAS